MYRDNGYEGIALEFQQEQMLAVKQMAESIAELARAAAESNKLMAVLLELLAEDRTEGEDITFVE